MKFIKDKKIICLIIVLILFTVVYFISVTRVSHAFSDSYDFKTAYNMTIKTIESSAKAYGEANQELFEKENIIYIKVQDLIDNKLLATNSSGNITNPLNAKKTLNSNIIKIKKEKEKILVEVDS